VDAYDTLPIVGYFAGGGIGGPYFSVADKAIIARFDYLVIPEPASYSVISVGLLVFVIVAKYVTLQSDH